MLKFRTMLDIGDASGEPLPDEARMTTFGSFLRSSSLDELSGLLSVLKGRYELSWASSFVDGILAGASPSMMLSRK
jgi:lipopolysaccharide/colanic/teichoic acid biosynthesis glycosyltransferase